MDIYVKIVEMYFKSDAKISQMVELYREELMAYQHHTHEKVVMFTNPYAAIDAIIDCEKAAHKMVKLFCKKVHHGQGKKVPIIDTVSKVEFKSISDAAWEFNLSPQHLAKMLRGQHKNTTTLEYKTA